ncbi:TetR family transcriptional regulator [Thiothrix nivea]|nr:TetR family transcriptional regulator [Thiothrix nivea]
MRRTNEDAILTRQKLLETALEEFVRVGYERATLQQIAQNAGMTRGAVYHHFASKAQIFSELVHDTSQELDALIAQLRVQGVSAQEQLRYVLVGIIRHLAKDSRYEAIARLILLETDGHSDLENVRKTLAARRQRQKQQLIQLFTSSQQRGELYPGLEAATAAEAVLIYQQNLHRHWISFRSFSTGQQLEDLVDILLRGIFI